MGVARERKIKISNEKMDFKICVTKIRAHKNCKQTLFIKLIINVAQLHYFFKYKCIKFS